MASVIPFSELSGDAAVAHGELALALGAEFGPLEPSAIDAALEPLVADLARQRARARRPAAAAAAIERQLARVRARLN